MILCYKAKFSSSFLFVRDEGVIWWHQARGERVLIERKRRDVKNHKTCKKDKSARHKERDTPTSAVKGKLRLGPRECQVNSSFQVKGNFVLQSTHGLCTKRDSLDHVFHASSHQGHGRYYFHHAHKNARTGTCNHCVGATNV